MYRTIIVGIDGTRAAGDAITLAQRLRAPEGTLVLTAVVPPICDLPQPPLRPQDRRHRLAYDALEQASRRVPADVPVELRTIDGPTPAAGLAAIAAARDADLIALGPTHRHTAGRVVGRTTASRVLHRTPCAVAVAAGGQDRRLRARPRLLVAYEASPQSTDLLDAAYDLAGAWSATVILCTILPPPHQVNTVLSAAELLALEPGREDAVRAELTEAAARAPEGVDVECRVLHGLTARRLLDETRAGVDFVLTGSRHPAAPVRAITGSVAATLLAHTDLPVLVTPRAPVKAPAPA